MKTYVGLVRDHSASMRSLQVPAMQDYNLTIDGIRQSLTEENQVGVATIVECGYSHTGAVKVRESRTPFDKLSSLTSYPANGSSTPLWDSVGAVIEDIENVYDKDDATVAFLVMVITDGEENSSRFWNAAKISRKIAELQRTDRWTFVFRVPRGNGKRLAAMGIPEGNIMEWEQTTAALEASTQATVSATKAYFSARSSGKTSVGTFYADLSNVSKSEVRQKLVDISGGIKRAYVGASDHRVEIKDFCNRTFGEYKLGSAYYQLNKPETIQAQKALVIHDKTTGHYYSGAQARQLVGLPTFSSAKVYPGNFGNYELYVQSTSTNRKLMSDTYVLVIN